MSGLGKPFTLRQIKFTRQQQVVDFNEVWVNFLTLGSLGLVRGEKIATFETLCYRVIAVTTMQKFANLLFIALAASVLALAFTPASAQYPYGGVIVEEVPIDPAQIATIQAAAGFTGTPRTWRVYVCVDDPDWAILQLFTNITGGLILSTWEVSCPTCPPGNNFYQTASLSPYASGISTALFPFLPFAQYDSWWTIGQPYVSGSTTVIGANIANVATQFEAGGSWFTDDGLSTMFLNTGLPCLGKPIDGKVLIGQFTTDGVLEGNVALTFSRRNPDVACSTYTPVEGFIVNNAFFTNDFLYSYGDATCLDMPSCPDFGNCGTVLGAAKINGVCTELTGCDFLAGGVDYSPFTFPSLQECIESTDFGSGPCYGLPSCIDFGNCGTSLGFTRVGSSCVEAFGCSTTVGPTDYSPFFYNTIDECVVACSEVFLSVELTEYTARAVENDQVRLRWITSSETNSDHFTVEHSTDMENWTLIDTQKAAGFSSEQLVYSSYDRTPSDGTNYYRLRQFDTDGSEQLREIRTVDFRASGPIPFPNPTNGHLRFKGDMSQVMFIRVSGMDGRTLLHYPVYGAGAPELDLSRLATGSYIVHLETASGRIFRHVVQRR